MASPTSAPESCAKARSVEADIAAFASTDELLPDAMAYLRDLGLSLEDLQACFPYIREIEAEALALDLQQGDAAAARNKAREIASAAKSSEIPLPEAKEALEQLEPDIDNAPNEIVRTRLIADNLLISRNFCAAVIRRAGGVAAKGVESGLVKSAEAIVLAGVAYLLLQILGPIGALAPLVTAFRPLYEAAKKIEDSAKKSTDGSAGSSAQEPDDGGDGGGEWV